MESKRIRPYEQTAIGTILGKFLIALSLFASSAAACVCSHHTERGKTEVSSCHEHSETGRESDSIENTSQLNSNGECDCLQPAPRVYAKSDTLNFAEQTAVLPISPKIEFKTVSTFVFAARIYFEKPFYLSDSFYNIKSPRAPPAA